MLIVRTANRASLFGGSTDIRSFYSEFGSFVINFALKKYCFLSCQHLDSFDEINYQIFASLVERVKQVKDISNPAVRGSLEYILSQNIKLPSLSFYIQNQLPSRTGVGSSSSLIVSMLNALYSLNQTNVDKHQLAKDAIYVERELLAEPGGVQDSIIASYGGFNSIEIKKDGAFYVRPLPISEDFKFEFTQSSLMFYVSQRNSFEASKSHDNKDAISPKKELLNLAYEAYEHFRKEDLSAIGNDLNRGWLLKRQLSNLISNNNIDGIYDTIMKAGAFGGKLMGAGSSGFIYVLFPKEKRKQIIDAVGLRYVDVDIDEEGSKVIFKG